jgi:hypothetical protein
MNRVFQLKGELGMAFAPQEKGTEEKLVGDGPMAL